MFSIQEPLIFSRLRDSRNVLVAGAGGGFDIFAALPLALWLLEQGKQVYFANLSFTYLGGTNASCLAPHLFVVREDTEGEPDYFPERVLSRWLHARGLPSTVYAFEKVGVRPLHHAYSYLCQQLAIDSVVLVDGGTDILMFGDEAGLGTPEEDMASLCAVSQLGLKDSYVACIGFGVDSYHGVCHAHFLENVAQLEYDGAYLGAFSLSRLTSQGKDYLDAVSYAANCTKGRESIVNGSIQAAVEGGFGDRKIYDRLHNSELFINPLMAIYFTFELMGIVRRSLYLEHLFNTQTIFDVAAVIEATRKGMRTRVRQPIPH